jgi:hypothetical protein
MLSSMFDDAVKGVPREVGASDEDLDRSDGAIDDDRELEWLCIVPGLSDETKGGRSRSEGGDTDLLLPCRNGDGHLL